MSSDWRHSNNRKELRCRLGEQGIIGWMQADETPIVIPTQDLETMDWFEPRRTEIQDWFLRTAYEGPYVILDDMVPLKTTEYGPRMVLCDWDLGFDGTALEQARNILKEQMK